MNIDGFNLNINGLSLVFCTNNVKYRFHEWLVRYTLMGNKDTKNVSG